MDKIPPGAGKPPSSDSGANTQSTGKKKPSKSGKKKGQKVSSAIKPKKTSSGSSISYSESSLTDSPLATRRSREHFLELKNIEQLPQSTPEQTRLNRERAIQTALDVISKEGKVTLETAYVMTSCLCQLYRQDEARSFAETLLELAPPGHPYHPLACLWMGITLYQINEHYDETIMGFLNTAHKAGIPLAAKYMMHAYSGITGSLCEVKWTDPKTFLKIARKFKQQQDEHYPLLRRLMTSNPLDLPVKQQMFHELRVQTEIKGMVVAEETIQEFNKLICELMTTPDRALGDICKRIEARIDEYSRSHPNYLLPILYDYALGSRDPSNQRVLDRLNMSSHCLAKFCAADLTKQRSKYPTQNQFDLLAESQQFIDAYIYEADMLLAKGNLSKTVEVYQLAIRHLTNYLNKKSPILHRLHGQQPEALKKGNYPEEYINEVELEELHSINEKIEFFQGQIELLNAELLESKIASQTVANPPSTQDSSSESDSEYYDAREFLSPSPNKAEDETKKPSPSPEPLESQEFKLVQRQKPKTKANTSKSTPTSPLSSEDIEFHRQLRAMSKANELAKKQKKYDQAERQLRENTYKQGSYLWFIQQGDLCWIDFLRATDPEYLVEQATKVSTQQYARELLESTQAKVCDQINTLALLSKVDVTQFETIEEKEEKCLEIAASLKAINPRLKDQYGGLYSKLGHLQKAMKDISPTRAAFKNHAKTGKHYYHLANLIRGRYI